MNEKENGKPSAVAVVAFLFLLLVAAAAQGTVSARLPHGWGQPDFVLTLALVAALLSDAATGALVGFASGLVTAALVGQTVGTFLVSRTLTGFTGGWTTARLYRGNVFVVILGVLLLSFLSELVYLLAAPRIGLGHGLRAALLGAVGNAVLAAPTLWILRRCGWGTRL